LKPLSTPSTQLFIPAGALHTLHPGDVVCAERGDRMETLLGSCIAVILTDRTRTIGAMCHIVHSQPSSNAEANPTAAADAAIDAMYRKLALRSLNPRLCHAFVYGGGNMFPALFTQTHVGEGNARQVLKRLQEDGIRIAIQDLGGNAYRRLSWTIGPELPQVVAVDV
jgi:chemotaxis protein CheD